MSIPSAAREELFESFEEWHPAAAKVIFSGAHVLHLKLRQINLLKIYDSLGKLRLQYYVQRS